MNETVVAASMVAGTVVLLLVWRSQTRDPERWRPWLAQRRWERAMAWAAVLTLAAAAGTLLAGGTREAGGIAVLGGGIVFGLFMIWSNARTFGPRD